MLELRLYSESEEALKPSNFVRILEKLSVEDGLVSRTTQTEDFFTYYSNRDTLNSEDVYLQQYDIEREPIDKHSNLAALLKRSSVLKVDIRRSPAVDCLVQAVQRHVSPAVFVSSVEGVKVGKSDIIVFDHHSGLESVRLIARASFCLYLISDSWMWSSDVFRDLLKSDQIGEFVERLEPHTGKLCLHYQTII